MNIKTYRLKKIRKKQDHLDFLISIVRQLYITTDSVEMATATNFRRVTLKEMNQQILFTKKLIDKGLIELRRMK